MLAGEEKPPQRGWEYSHILSSSPPLSVGDTFKDSGWMPETMESTEPYIHYVFSYTYIHTCILFHLKEAL